jgi:hypothetical protein
MDNRNDHRLTKPLRNQNEHAQKMGLINLVMICVGFLVCMQTLAFNVAIEGFMGGEENLIMPALVISGICLVGTCWLLRGLYKI